MLPFYTGTPPLLNKREAKRSAEDGATSHDDATMAMAAASNPGVARYLQAVHGDGPASQAGVIPPGAPRSRRVVYTLRQSPLTPI